MIRLPVLLGLLCVCAAHAASPYPEPTPDTPANRTLDRYWAAQTERVHAHGSLDNMGFGGEDWASTRAETRRQLAEMLGLDPMPARTPLNPVKTGEVKGDGYRVEKLQFQSMPGLYVTANFYVPDKVDKPLPTILYVCGHAVMKADGVSLGNKTGYEHHGVWFARHGYTCLIIDTLQLGEIEGEHHGLHHLNKWWWMARGYTPAGVEAWNGIRALDYLESRPEVDKTRFGVTGRSGGGAYSWWIAALDERIKAAAPTAGITSLKNYVVDGCVEGHCDCMFMVNTYRWDYDRVMGLVAPRALLVCNTDKDPIFPISGVFQLYQSARRLYASMGAEDKIGLQVAEGPHKDVQPLNTGAFHWFERFLKGADPMATTDEAARKTLDPKSLRVFADLPKDQHNTRIDHEFVPLAKTPPVPATAKEWEPLRDQWLKALKEKVFAAWPLDTPSVEVHRDGAMDRDGITMTAFDFASQEPFHLRLWIAHRAGLRFADLELVALNVLDEEGWKQFEATYHQSFGKLFDLASTTPHDVKGYESEQGMFKNFKWAMAYVAPRGVGALAWTGSDKAQIQRLRRFYLLGETKESGQVWDIRRTLQAIRGLDGLTNAKLWLTSTRQMATNCLYASLFEEGISRVDLHEMPASHVDGPMYLNVLRYLDVPQAAAMASERTKVVIYAKDKKPWEFVGQTAEKLGWPKNVQMRDVGKAE